MGAGRGGTLVVAVAGSGPAGLAAAETLARGGLGVVIFERTQSPARKFLMAGRGGLNLTHSEPLEQFLTRYAAVDDPMPGALEDALRAFTPDALRAWAEDLGQPTFVGSSGRVFPRAMKASPLVRAWLARLDALGVELRTRQTWTGWSSTGQPTFLDEGGHTYEFPCAALVLALGGASWPKLGSDGTWVSMLRAAGVEVTPLIPSNTGLKLSWSAAFADRFAGTPLKRIAVTYEGRRQRGEAIITREGLEGGAVYALSSALARATAQEHRALIHLDLKPDQTADDLASRLARTDAKASFSNRLRKALRLSPAAIGLLRESAARLPPSETAALADLIKAVPLHVTGVCGLERAISTAGGVAFDALDPGFMLTGRPGVFIAGEMLDWDAPTGGYLIQAAIASGIAAAQGVLDRLGIDQAQPQTRGQDDTVIPPGPAGP